MAGKGKRRGRGEGTISYREKEGRHEGRYYVDTPEGKRKRRIIYGKSYEECRQKLAAAISDRDRGLIFDPENLTFGEYLDRWLRDSVEGSVRRSTYERYSGIVRKHLKPALGSQKLSKLKVAHLEGLYRAKLSEGASPRTVEYIHRTAHKALKEAVRWELVPRNVAAAAKAPHGKPKDMHPLDREQARRLLEAAQGSRLEALFVLALSTGMRRGELCGLKWKDVHLDDGQPSLVIRRALVVGKGGAYISEPKRASSRRRIELSERTAEALKAHRACQREEKMANRGVYEESGFVFTHKLGGWMVPTNLIPNYFEPLLEEAGLPRIRFHDLRHTYATLALMANTPAKIVSEVLGHGDVKITLSTYSHVLPGMQSDAAARMDSMLF